jgi:cold shock protein
MITGKVKWFNQDKGYGFIAPAGGGDDVFVHVSAVRYGKILKENDPVEFETETSERGLKAKHVRLTNNPLAETTKQK